MYYNMYDNTYGNDMYPIRYSRELPGRVAPDYRPAPPPEQGHAPIFDDYPMHPTMPNDHYHCPTPMPMPCPMPMPMPEETLPATEMTGEEYLAELFMKLMGKKVNILIEGRQKTVECVKVIKVEDAVVIVELKTGGVCVIPLKDISAVCMSKELAQEFYDC